jgi:dihydrofolate reductase
LTFSINITLDGCVDHQEGIADDETHAFFTRLMDEGGAMLWGRITYEMMECYWPAIHEWAVKLEAKPKYVVSSTRKDFSWTNSHHIADDLRTGVQRLKDATPAGVLLGSGKLATDLDRLDLIDEYKLLVHPRIAGKARPCTRAGCPVRDGSSWSRRSRSAMARSPCTTGANADFEQPLAHSLGTCASRERCQLAVGFGPVSMDENRCAQAPGRLLWRPWLAARTGGVRTIGGPERPVPTPGQLERQRILGPENGHPDRADGRFDVQISVRSASSNASSTSTPRYLTVFSILE